MSARPDRKTLRCGYPIPAVAVNRDIYHTGEQTAPAATICHCAAGGWVAHVVKQGCQHAGVALGIGATLRSRKPLYAAGR